MKKHIIIFLMIVASPMLLWAQETTIGKSKEEIRKIIQSNPNFKLLPGINSDTLSFQPMMQTVFNYKDSICYRSASVLPLKYIDAVVQHMKDDSYKELSNNIWINSFKTIRVEITVDKNKEQCLVVTTAVDSKVKN